MDQRLRLGQLVSDDIEVKPSTQADTDDDDGVVNPGDLHVTGLPVIDVSVTNQTTQDATLYGWIDTNFDGEFDESERAYADVPGVSADLPVGTVDQVVTLVFPELPDGLAGTTYARFRLSTDQAAAQPTGPALDGEVEDYLVTIDTPTTFGAKDTVRIQGHTTYNQFGTSVAWLGDLDNNGVDDLAVGSSQRDTLSVLLMNEGGSVKSRVHHSTTGYDRWSTFGGSVASIGDLNGDGITDIAVGASGERGLTGYDTGAVHILFLNADGTEKSRTVITDGVPGAPDLLPSDSFGSAVAAIGDVNGDGVVDLAVGARNDSSISSRTGAVHILFMNTDGTVQSYSKIGHNYGGGPSLKGFGYFGAAVTALGDWNGDDIPDLAVSASQEDVYNAVTGVYQRKVGSVYLFTLDRDGTASTTMRIPADVSGLPLVEGDYFGTSIALVGDLDENGVNDLAVGAPGDDTGGSDHGAVYLLLMNADGSVKDNVTIAEQLNGGPDLPDSETDWAWFGSALATMPDLDGNGLPELAIGTRLELGGGAVYVTYLTDEFRDFGDAMALADAEIESIQTDAIDPQLPDIYPSALRVVGDVNSDGVVDYAAVISVPVTTPTFYYQYGIDVLLMNADGTVDQVQRTLSDADSTTYSRLGMSSDLGDLDGDGVVDIAMLLEARDNIGAYGRVDLFYLNSDGTAKKHVEVDPSLIPGLPLDAAR